MSENNWERIRLIEEMTTEIDKILMTPFKSAYGLLSDFYTEVPFLLEQAKHAQKLCELYNERSSSLTARSFENKKLREALEFYADKMHYINFHDQYLDELPSEIDFDEGKRARQVLEEINNGMV